MSPSEENSSKKLGQKIDAIDNFYSDKIKSFEDHFKELDNTIISVEALLNNFAENVENLVWQVNDFAVVKSDLLQVKSFLETQKKDLEEKHQSFEKRLQSQSTKLSDQKKATDTLQDICQLKKDADAKISSEIELLKSAISSQANEIKDIEDRMKSALDKKMKSLKDEIMEEVKALIPKPVDTLSQVNSLRNEIIRQMTNLDATTMDLKNGVMRVTQLDAQSKLVEKKIENIYLLLKKNGIE